MFVFYMIDCVFEVFVWHPGRIWCVSAVFGVLFLLTRLAKTRYPQIRSLPLLIVALLWLAYGFEERQAMIERANIRVDLAVIFPVLFFGTTIAMVLCIESVTRAARLPARSNVAGGNQ
jgi:uncharacterized membrane protein